MSNLFSGISGRFRGAAKNPSPKSPGALDDSRGSSPTQSLPGSTSTSSLAPRFPPFPPSPSLSQSFSLDSQSQAADSEMPSKIDRSDPLSTYNLPRPKPLWLNNAYAKQIVKGNFMTLSAKPKTVEMGEWVAHQVVEHYRNLWNFVKVIHEKEDDGRSICNSRSCPKMSAGDNHSFTWLNSQRQPVEVPAWDYISLMQRWISGKIDNQAIFPTDPAGVSYSDSTAAPVITASTYASGDLATPGAAPIPAGPTTLNAPLSTLAGSDWVGKSSGFPYEFFDVCQTIFRQMFRVYAHLYWAHFVDPFYHLSISSHLNSCFSHFVLTATALDLLKAHELEPMQALIDLWAANGTFPPNSKAYQIANLQAGEKLLSLSSAVI